MNDKEDMPQDWLAGLNASTGDNADGSGTEEKGENCISGERLSALIDSKCFPDEIKEIRTHIEECTYCRKRCMTIASFKMSAMRTPTSTDYSNHTSMWRWGCFLFAFVITAGLMVLATKYYINNI